MFFRNLRYVIRIKLTMKTPSKSTHKNLIRKEPLLQLQIVNILENLALKLFTFSLSARYIGIYGIVIQHTSFPYYITQSGKYCNVGSALVMDICNETIHY